MRKENRSYLKPWLDRKSEIVGLKNLYKSKPDFEVGGWLALNCKIPFHKVQTEKILGLSEAWDLNNDYYEQAILIAKDYNGELEHEDTYDILYKLGEPPDVSHPIYLITIEKDEEIRLMYVGKSASNNSRFKAGHSVAIKLLSPIYNSYDKYVYFGQVMLFNTDEQYLPLEFIGDKELATEILDDVESMLIKYLSPELNIKKTITSKIKNKFSLHIQNTIYGSRFLNDKML